jgi:hypothetical protein
MDLVCAKCKQCINSFRAIYDPKVQYYVYTAYCHGEKEKSTDQDHFLTLKGSFFDDSSSTMK